MADDADERFQKFNTIKVPAVIIPSDGDRTAPLRAGICDPIRIPVTIVRKDGEPRSADQKNFAPG